MDKDELETRRRARELLRRISAEKAWRPDAAAARPAVEVEILPPRSINRLPSTGRSGAKGSVAVVVAVAIVALCFLFVPLEHVRPSATLGATSPLPAGYGTVTAAQGGDKAASAKTAIEAHNLGVRYVKGDGFPKDPVRARDLFLQAAVGGVAQSAYNLGTFYESGFGVPKDAATAWAWYARADRMGDAGAKAKMDALAGSVSQQAKDAASVQVAAMLSTSR